MKKRMNVRKFVTIGMLSSIAYVLMFLNFPLPPFPSFLMVDFSDIPALLAALIFGPLAGVLVELIKNILDYFLTGSDTGIPIGHLTNFVAGITFILPTYYIYNKLKSKRGMVIGLISSTVLMSVLLSVLNYYVILPIYMYLASMPTMTSVEVRQMVVTGILPFNILKGVIITAVFMLLFVKMHAWITKQITYRSA